MNFLRTRRALLTCAVFSAAALAPLAHAQQVLRVTTIPEEAATEQIRKFTPLASYLEKALGMKVEFTPVNDYPAAVEALVNKKVDVVWFGGFTHVQANIRSGGKIVPLAQREEDTKFQSVFIAKTDSGIKSLADLKQVQTTLAERRARQAAEIAARAAAQKQRLAEQNLFTQAIGAHWDAHLARMVDFSSLQNRPGRQFFRMALPAADSFLKA